MRHGRAASGINGGSLGAPLAKATSGHEGLGTGLAVLLENGPRRCWNAQLVLPSCAPPVLESSNSGAGTGHYGCYNPPSQLLEPSTMGATSCRRHCWNLRYEELQPAISFATNGTTICWNGPTVLLQPARGTALTATGVVPGRTATHSLLQPAN